MKHAETENNLILIPEGDIVSSRVKELIALAKSHMETAENYEKLVLDLSEVKIIDSIGITFVIGLFKNAKNSGKVFKVTSVSTDIQHLFMIMKLDQLFEIE